MTAGTTAARACGYKSVSPPSGWLHSAGHCPSAGPQPGRLHPPGERYQRQGPSARPAHCRPEGRHKVSGAASPERPQCRRPVQGTTSPLSEEYWLCGSVLFVWKCFSAIAVNNLGL